MILEVMDDCHAAREGEETLIRVTPYRDEDPDAAYIRAQDEARRIYWFLCHGIQARTYDQLAILFRDERIGDGLRPR